MTYEIQTYIHGFRWYTLLNPHGYGILESGKSVLESKVIPMGTDAYMHEKYLEYVKAFRLFDDDFLKEVFDNNHEATELVLNIILDRTDLKVQKVVGQREIKGIEGHSVRLDILAEDSDGKVYDIEIQRSDRGNLPLRARYNSSMMDTILLQEGQDYSKLVPTYVIFIVEGDAIGDGRPLDHYVMKNVETNAALGDERHIVFVNGNNPDEETALGKLIHDFKCTVADEMYYDVLAKRVRHFKESEGGITQMCKMLEDMRNEAAREAAYEATIKSAVETARVYNVTDFVILKDIMDRFHLTQAEAEAYMERKPA